MEKTVTCTPNYNVGKSSEHPYRDMHKVQRN